MYSYVQGLRVLKVDKSFTHGHGQHNIQLENNTGGVKYQFGAVIQPKVTTQDKAQKVTNDLSLYPFTGHYSNRWGLNQQSPANSEL